jgi:hypothetical protein
MFSGHLPGSYPWNFNANPSWSTKLPSSVQLVETQLTMITYVYHVSHSNPSYFLCISVQHFIIFNLFLELCTYNLTPLVKGHKNRGSIWLVSTSPNLKFFPQKQTLRVFAWCFEMRATYTQNLHPSIAKKKINSKLVLSWTCRHTAVILVFRRLRQKDYKFKASLAYIVRPCFKGKKTTNTSIPPTPTNQ